MEIFKLIALLGLLVNCFTIEPIVDSTNIIIIMLKKLFISFLILLLIAAGAIAYKVWTWQTMPLELSQEHIDFQIPRGSSVRTVADLLAKQDVDVDPFIFTWYSRYTGQDKLLKAGAYEIKRGQTALDVLNMMASGDMSRRTILIVEGWTYKQIRAAIAANSDIQQTLKETEDSEILQRLNVDPAITSLEGLLYPDTYVFVPGDSDFDIVRRAYTEGQKRLNKAWEQRQVDLPLKSPYEALILASIVEKETGHGEDRGKIAGVFTNRLNIKMPLQTDPTVIYGMGEKYQGRIRKVDLQTDTPWNTYTRNGLPPTPIASPGTLALEATLNPEQHKFLYFVSRGDGTSAFAENLRDHNRNVQVYILKKGTP